MTNNQVKIQYLVRKLRYRYKTEKDSEDKETRSLAEKKDNALSHILWYSYPIVYGSNDDMLVATRAIEARKRKKNRYNQKIREMGENYEQLHFVTLTWDEASLRNLKENVRKKYVQRFLNDICNDYLANVDYGKKNQREHFHAVVALKDGVLKLNTENSKKNPYIDGWSYGFSNVKPIHLSSDTVRKTSSYLLKLSNHAGKLGTGKAFKKKNPVNIDNLPF